MKKRWWLLLAALLLIMPASSLAEAARDITAECAVTFGGKRARYGDMVDRKYSTYFIIKRGGAIEVDGRGQPLGGIYLQFYDRSSTCEIQAEQDGAWVTVDTGGTHLSDCFPLPEGTLRARIVNTDKARMFLAEMTVLSPGDLSLLPRWEEPGKADLLLLVAHPDDELLWFGGLLPTYAGERGAGVQVAYLVPATPLRRLEMLDALWQCGVKRYPLFAGMRDVRSDTLSGQYKKWNRARLQEKIVAMFRQVQPEVVVTHDFAGEYGHGAHRAAADIAVRAVKAAADASMHAASAREYGPWQVKKLYIHLYGEHQLTMNWHAPLSAFGGADSLSVAQKAMLCHKSQVKHGWQVEDGGENDNSLFGLYFTCVGPDEAKNDFLEHIE